MAPIHILFFLFLATHTVYGYDPIPVSPERCAQARECNFADEFEECSANPWPGGRCCKDNMLYLFYFDSCDPETDLTCVGSGTNLIEGSHGEKCNVATSECMCVNLCETVDANACKEDGWCANPDHQCGNTRDDGTGKCQCLYCGDGIVSTSIGEECDSDVYHRCNKNTCECRGGSEPDPEKPGECKCPDDKPAWFEGDPPGPTTGFCVECNSPDDCKDESGIEKYCDYESHTCKEKTGICCGTGSQDECTEVTHSECKNADGTFYVNKECGSFSCPDGDPGACCGSNAGASCWDANKFICESDGGTFHSNQSCDSSFICPGTGACCSGNTCEDNIEEKDCSSGTFFVAKKCSDKEVHDICGKGACCNETSKQCTESLEEECNENDGDFQGVGSVCSEDTCTFPEDPYCGDGIVQPNGKDGIEGTADDEQCDDGDANADEANKCKTDCKGPRCGDSILDAGEECDDGNSDNYDGCLDSCEVAQCSTDADCTGQYTPGDTLYQCDWCINGWTRKGCACNEGKCKEQPFRDCSCTTGECNRCEEAEALFATGQYKSNCGPYGSDVPNTYWMCEWCMVDKLFPPGPGPAESDTCEPYPNAEIIWPDQCNASGGASPPPPTDANDDEGETASAQNPCETDTGSAGSTGSCHSASDSSASDTDDSADEGADTDDSSISLSSDESISSILSSEDSSSSTSLRSADSISSQDNSSSIAYEQCDFCPACTACRRCGIGMTNLCDSEECGELGLCTFEPSIFGGTCIADLDVCSVCQ